MNFVFLFCHLIYILICRKIAFLSPVQRFQKIPSQWQSACVLRCDHSEEAVAVWVPNPRCLRLQRSRRCWAKICWFNMANCVHGPRTEVKNLIQGGPLHNQHGVGLILKLKHKTSLTTYFVIKDSTSPFHCLLTLIYFETISFGVNNFIF